MCATRGEVGFTFLTPDNVNVHLRLPSGLRRPGDTIRCGWDPARRGIARGSAMIESEQPRRRYSGVTCQGKWLVKPRYRKTLTSPFHTKYPEDAARRRLPYNCGVIERWHKRR